MSATLCKAAQACVSDGVLAVRGSIASPGWRVRVPLASPVAVQVAGTLADGHELAGDQQRSALIQQFHRLGHGTELVI